MSRIANNPITVPDSVEVDVNGAQVRIKGSKGELMHTLHSLVQLDREDNLLKFSAKDDTKSARALAGTTRAILQNMVTGVTDGFEIKLEITGVGYRAQANRGSINLALGFSHPVDMDIPDGITVETPSQTQIVVRGPDKQKVGQVAARSAATGRPSLTRGKECGTPTNRSCARRPRKRNEQEDGKTEKGGKVTHAHQVTGLNRLCVFRTPRHIYAQVIAAGGAEVLVSASSLDKEVRSRIKNGGNREAAGIVGQVVAERAKKAGITTVAFDRSGFKFHGRVKALADAAREQGIKF